MLFFNVTCTLCTNMSSFWPSNTSEFQILDTEANYWFIFIWFFDPAPTLSVQFIVTKFRMVMALIRTDKQTLKESYCASEPGAEE